MFKNRMAKDDDNFLELTEEQKAATIPYYVHRGMLYKISQQSRRWFIAWLVTFVLFAGYVFYNASFETYVYTQDYNADQAPQTAVMNNGTGTVNYNGSKDQAGGADQSTQNQPEQPNETVPNL